MKTLTALFAAAALTLTAGLAQADVRPDLIPGLLKAGTIMDLEKLNQTALAQHPGTTAASITDTELEHSRLRVPGGTARCQRREMGNRPGRQDRQGPGQQARPVNPP